KRRVNLYVVTNPANARHLAPPDGRPILVIVHRPLSILRRPDGEQSFIGDVMPAAGTRAGVYRDPLASSRRTPRVRSHSGQRADLDRLHAHVVAWTRAVGHCRV